MSQEFIATFGKPEPAAPSGLQFTNAGVEFVWETFYEQIGAGWYQNRFWYLFGEGLEQFKPCLDAWSFLVTPGTERMILGRNAFGALLVLENPNEIGPSSRAAVLDPLQVSYWVNPSAAFGNLLGHHLPNKVFPATVMDDRFYQAWQQGAGRYLDMDEMLAIRVPLSLDGKMEGDNFQVEKMVSYYRTTAPVYEKAFAQLRKQP